MKTLEDLYRENPEEYRIMAIEANKQHKKLIVVDDKLAFEDIEQPEPTYVDKRKAEYPSIEDQLDMLYHDKENGTNQWFEIIRGVKERFPKSL